MADHDEMISNFIEFAQCSAEVASDLLAASNWDFNRAIEFFFGSTKEQPKMQPQPPPPMKPKKPMNEERPPQERLILAGTNERFQEARKMGTDRNRWLIVFLTEEELPLSVLRCDQLRDFMSCRYIPLEISRDKTDGQWFYHTYQIREVPVFCIIDPLTGELLDKRLGPMSNKDLIIWLRQFLFDHPSKGFPIDIEISRLEKDDNETEDEELEETQSEESEDVGQMIGIMLQMPNGKRTKIEIGENQSVHALQKKVALLTDKKIDEFKLVLAPFVELDDPSKQMKDLNAKNSLIRVLDA